MSHMLGSSGCSSYAPHDELSVTRLIHENKSLKRDNEMISNDLIIYKQLHCAQNNRLQEMNQFIATLKAIIDKLATKWPQEEVHVLRVNESISETKINKWSSHIISIEKQLMTSKSSPQNNIQQSGSCNEAVNTCSKQMIQQWNNKIIANDFNTNVSPRNRVYVHEKANSSHCNNNKWYRCDALGCNKVFSNRDDMQSHLKTHLTLQVINDNKGDEPSMRSLETVTNEYEDNMKDNGISSEDMLLPHVELEIIECQSQNADPYIVAEDSYDNEERLRKQLVTCDLCGKHFKKSYMPIHARSHTGQKPYKCSFEGCDRTFTQSSSRNFHEKTYHSNNFPFRCCFQSCGKLFSRQTDLQKHEDQHSLDVQVVKVMPSRKLRKAAHRTGKHQCKDCGKSFSHKIKLRQHEVMHSGFKQFKCNFDGCHYESYWKQNLTMHLRRLHNQNV